MFKELLAEFDFEEGANTSSIFLPSYNKNFEQIIK